MSDNKAMALGVLVFALMSIVGMAIETILTFLGMIAVIILDPLFDYYIAMAPLILLGVGVYYLITRVERS